ncbi:hypothetical protein GQ55_6G283700 [Panicum hallii var. hallii]|uniref:Uncharacterized protein n=1 Tax=Panicum hallii var. hallii TaxID=1504633 RepID=A0A2T7DAH5_9POAL|nr:hypothetical protein GQ55_6G283700 [Panicum hallii var. hallii]
MAGEAATALRGAPAGAAGPSRSRSPPRFTALELAAAEQLIHLSESSCSSGAAAPTPRGGGLLLPASAASAASSSTSPRSVNNAPPPAAPPAAVAEDEEDDDEQEVGGRRRRNKRYRPIAEIYAATDPKPIGPRRRKAEDRPRPAAAKAKELGATE